MGHTYTPSQDDTWQTRYQLPVWVPHGVLHYLVHTEVGVPIRELARVAGCHASTVLRQVRRVETRRDDPLIDAVLRRLGTLHQHDTNRPDKDNKKMKDIAEFPDEETLTREAARVLRRLCETGAVLAVAAEMDKAVVVRETPGGASTRTAVVDSNIAQAMALKDWIASTISGRITRYHITGAGRTALTSILQKLGGGAEPAGLAEAAAVFEPAKTAAPATPVMKTARYTLAESPLTALSRRRNPDGTAFLDDGLVHAGERLREDFELAQMDPNITADWQDLAQGKVAPPQADADGRHVAARDRMVAALQELGPGLADVVLRCCCYLEGLETTEKALGWSARSGKIVLRIALVRLKRHYDETLGTDGAMIG